MDHINHTQKSLLVVVKATLMGAATFSISSSPLINLCILDTTVNYSPFHITTYSKHSETQQGGQRGGEGVRWGFYRIVHHVCALEQQVFFLWTIFCLRFVKTGVCFTQTSVDRRESKSSKTDVF